MIGRPIDNTEIKIVDEQGKIVPLGTPGELCTRGYSVMKGYWDEPEKTGEAIDQEMDEIQEWFGRSELDDQYLRYVLEE